VACRPAFEETLKAGATQPAAEGPVQEAHLAIQVRLDAYRARGAGHHRLASQPPGQQAVELRPHGVAETAVQTGHTA
jgi:hypothetical protein